MNSEIKIVRDLKYILNSQTNRRGVRKTDSAQVYEITEDKKRKAWTAKVVSPRAQAPTEPGVVRKEARRWGKVKKSKRGNIKVGRPAPFSPEQSSA